jgi:hypothetical protein
MLKKIKVDLNFDYFLNQDYSQSGFSCISYQQREQKDLYEEYGDTSNYTESNTHLQQLWYEDGQVNYKELGEKLGMEVITVSSILQPPGNIITLHRDTFFKIKQQYPNDERLLVRANIYLEDWKVGHVIQYKQKLPNNIVVTTDTEWKTSDNWKQGEGFIWSTAIPHLSGNIGVKPKYTLQVSGFLNK